MAKAKKRSRLILTFIVLLLIGGALTAAFWPRPTMVDLGEVTRGPMMVTIDEEGRTRVAETYVVSTPVAGRLQRVQVDPGDRVERGKTVVAHMLPTNPAALDVRTREQAQAAVQAAEAALRLAPGGPELGACQSRLRRDRTGPHRKPGRTPDRKPGRA